jgi:large subunit ribosomal protein L7/L12
MSSFVVSRILPSSRRALCRLAPRTSASAATLPTRPFSSEQEAPKTSSSSSSDNDIDIDFSSPQVKKLYDEIVQLPKEEVNILGAMVIQILGQKIFPGEFGGGVPGGAGAAMDGAAEEPAQEAKTIFDVKLMGFDAKSKIKVIKEVRAITGLGLKEAKALVESAPKVLSKDVKQEQADELKEKLEAVGALVEIV